MQAQANEGTRTEERAARASRAFIVCFIHCMLCCGLGVLRHHGTWVEVYGVESGPEECYVSVWRPNIVDFWLCIHFTHSD